MIFQYYGNKVFGISSTGFEAAFWFKLFTFEFSLLVSDFEVSAAETGAVEATGFSLFLKKSLNKL